MNEQELLANEQERNVIGFAKRGQGRKLETMKTRNNENDLYTKIIEIIQRKLIKMKIIENYTNKDYGDYTKEARNNENELNE